MSVITVSRHIDAAPSDVFAVMTDFQHAAERIEGIKSLEVLTDGEVGVGTRFRETRIMFGREATEEMEITEYNPGESYVLEANSCGCHYRTRISVTPDGNGSHVEFRMDAKPLTFLARAMSMVCFFMTGPLKKCIMKDLDDVASYLQGDGAVGVSPA